MGHGIAVLGLQPVPCPIKMPCLRKDSVIFKRFRHRKVKNLLKRKGQIKKCFMTINEQCNVFSGCLSAGAASSGKWSLGTTFIFEINKTLYIYI